MDNTTACLSGIKDIEPAQLFSRMNVLLGERLERKTNDVLHLLKQYNNDWNEVFYITLTRAFGFGSANEAFEQLAKSLPFRYIQKQRTFGSHIEAMLFGQAGMLEEEIEDRHYYGMLRQDYKFFRHKYGLKPVGNHLFGNVRTRAFISLAQLSALWFYHDSLFHIIRDEENPEKLKRLFKVQPSDFWQTHYNFRSSGPASDKSVSEGAANIFMINVVIPILSAYGRKNNLPEYNERAIHFIKGLPAEDNAIVRPFRSAGMEVHNAGDSQAVIQLKKEYCDNKKCFRCPIGFQSP
jgi:hypothetical protein